MAQYLTAKHGFVLLHLDKRHDSIPGKYTGSQQEHKVRPCARENTITAFSNVQSLVDFVTERWRERWVTTDIWDEDVLKYLSRRPSFILVGVDAPVSVRWHRLRERYVCDILDPA